MKNKVYEIITKQIIEKLESGVAPWKKSWKESMPPRNIVSKKYYRGINHVLLTAAEFHSSYWLTFKQASELGGKIRKGYTVGADTVRGIVGK